MTDGRDERGPVWSEDKLDVVLDALRGAVHTDERELARRRVTLLAAAAAQGAVTDTRANCWVRRRRFLTAAAAVLVLAAAGLVAENVLIGTGPSAAAVGLNAAADQVVVGASDPPVLPGQYLLITSRGWAETGTTADDGRNFYWLEEAVTQVWVPARWSDTWTMTTRVTGRRKWTLGSEREADAAGVPRNPSIPDQGVHRARCGDFHPNPGDQPCTRPGGWQFPTPQWWASLPTDPQHLYERLQSDAPANSRGDVELLVYAADALRTGLLPADVRSTLYRALGRIPGLQVTDRAANLDGRIGVAYGMDDGTLRHEIIVDPKTGLFIGERMVLTKASDGRPAGTITSSGSMTATIVDHVRTR